MTQAEFTLALNCDYGDGLADEAVLPHMDAVNISCGALSMGEDQIRASVRLCQSLGLAIGAAPSQADHAGHGRNVSIMAAAHVAASVRSQVALLTRIAAESGTMVRHVRLHGALGQFAATNPDIALAVAEALAALDGALTLIAPYGSHLIDAARRLRMRYAAEVSADRVYEPDGTLRGRGVSGALIEDFDASLAQLANACQRGYVVAHTGAKVFLEAHTAHIDARERRAAARAMFLRRELPRSGVRCAPFAAAGSS